MPLGLKIYQTFKNRWCGAYLQNKGIKVIPSLAWGEPETYMFCFNGVEGGSIVAVSTIGVKTEKELFMLGYNEMLRKIKPSAIICYGTPFDEMKGNVIAVDYAATNNLKPRKSYILYKTYRYDNFEKGMGGAGGSLPNNVSINPLTDTSPIRSVPINKLPDNVRRAYEGYNSVNW